MHTSLHSGILIHQERAIPGDRQRRLSPPLENLLTLPVAPQHASLASSITTFIPLALPSSAKNRAAEAPVIPDPTTTTSATDGNSGVVRCPSRNFEGSLCQNDAVDFSLGRPALLLEPEGAVAPDMLRVMVRVEDGGMFMALEGVLVAVKVVFRLQEL